MSEPSYAESNAGRQTGSASATVTQFQTVSQQNMNDDNVEIDLREVFYTLAHGWKTIFLCLLICGVIMAAVHTLLVKPSYMAYTELYITSSDSVISLQDLQVGSALTQDYANIIKSRNVLGQVIDELDLNVSYEQLAGMVSVSNPTDTHIIHTEVTTDSIEMSRDIANSLLNISLDEIYQIVGTSVPTVIDYAEAEAVKNVTPSFSRYVIIGALVGALIACAVLIIRLLSDNTIHTEDDIEKYLALPVLAAVPYFDEEGR